MTDSERLAQLLKYLKNHGFALEILRSADEYPSIIEKSADGGTATTGFVIFPLDSDDAANQAQLLDRNPASAYNARCKIAMFVPGISGPPDTPNDWTPPKSLEQHADRDSEIMRVFREFDPKRHQ